MRGKLITFEGIDGSGKSTQIELLSKKLDNYGIENIILREPGGTQISEKIRNVLLDNNNDINDCTETLLFLSSRSQLVNEVIIPSLDKGIFVLCDRYVDSTVAYQGYGRGLDLDKINILNEFAVNKLYPDLTIIFDIDISISLDRMSSRSIKKDRMEQIDSKIIKKIKYGYLQIAKNNKDRCIIINGNDKSIEEINNELVSLFNFKYKGMLK